MKQTKTLLLSSSWQWRKLLLSIGVIVLSLASLTCPLWRGADEAFFHFLNAPMANSHALRLFWGTTSHKLVDWIEDLAFLTLYVIAIIQSGKGNRIRRTAQLVFVILLSATTIILINRLFFRDLLSLHRDSPSRILPSFVAITDSIPWLGVKTLSSKSFPGDHATLALLLSIGYAHFVRGRLGVVALCLGLFLCLPRLATGPHWLSDIVAGSGSIALFALSIAFFTPLSSYCIRKLEKGMATLFPNKG